MSLIDARDADTLVNGVHLRLGTMLAVADDPDEGGELFSDLLAHACAVMSCTWSSRVSWNVRHANQGRNDCRNRVGGMSCCVRRQGPRQAESDFALKC